MQLGVFKDKYYEINYFLNEGCEFRIKEQLGPAETSIRKSLLS